MIEHAEGNLLLADAEALVNTVNCIGYMGKGIALQFKQAFPENFTDYQKACRATEVQPGRMHIHATGAMVNPSYIINFPTKRHWRGKSRMEDIDLGLRALVSDIQRLGIRSIAIPPLGCGNGGLDWSLVRPKIEEAFAELPDVRVLLYAPTGAPDARTMPVRTQRPRMTPARALFIKLMDIYAAHHYRRTLLEVQKLAYFLQEEGEPLQLRFEKGRYGPYAHVLNKVLERIEGHYTRGFGDTHKPDTELELLPGAVSEADAFLADHPDSLKRLERVSDLIAGFETPYGMELLASVHWVAMHDDPPARSEQDAERAVRNWNERKRRVFQANHLQVAWQRLENNGWLG